MRWFRLKLEHNSACIIYRKPFGAAKTGETVRIRIAVESVGIPDKVQLIIGNDVIDMYYHAAIGGMRMYECAVKMPEEEGLIFYCFAAEADGETAYYGNNEAHLGGKGVQQAAVPESKYQITVYRRGYKTPDWMKNAVVYQIFPDRFSRGEQTPLHGIPRTWGEEPYYRAEQFGGTYLSNDFFGGNFSGIEEKLGYLKELGVSAIYLNPVFKAFSNHRYDTSDYENTDPALGTNEDFKRLIKKAEAMGIRVILDGVFSHTGADSKYFNKYNNFDSVGAYQSKESPFYGWYSFLHYPDKYESWWGFETLPNINELDESFLDYIARGENAIVKRWIKNGASGWRLDVADELPDKFIEILRENIKKQDPEALLLGEVWEDASNKVSYGVQRRFLWGKWLDSVMNYVFRDAILSYLTGADARLFFMRIMSLLENYPKESLYACLNLISSHDVPRAMTVLSGAPDFHTMTRQEQHDCVLTEDMKALARKRMYLALVIQMTLPGAPCIYYGDEIGMTGYADPFNRKCFDWGKTGDALLEHTKKMAHLRRENACLRTGRYVPLYYINGVICYMREITGGTDEFGEKCENGSIAVIVNAAETAEKIELNLSRFFVSGYTDIESGKHFSGSIISENTEPMSYKIYSLERNGEKCVKIQPIQY